MITQHISSYPEAPYQTDEAEEFNSKADAYVAHQANNFVDEVNEWTRQANDLETAITNAVAALPTGSVDDTTVATDKTYSSSRLEESLEQVGSGAIAYGRIYNKTTERKYTGTDWESTGLEFTIYKKKNDSAISAEALIYIGAMDDETTEARWRYSTDGGTNWINLGNDPQTVTRSESVITYEEREVTTVAQLVSDYSGSIIIALHVKNSTANNPSNEFGARYGTATVFEADITP